MATLTEDEVRHLLSYDPATGVLRWRVKPAKRIAAGAVTGCVGPGGYKVIGLKGRVVNASRVAWLLMTGDWPEHDIDHINGDTSDDRWINLRSATRSENMCNRRKQSNNTSGHKGVYFETQRKKWRSRITKGKVTTCLGFHDSAEAAAAVYAIAASRVHGPFATSR